MRPAKSWRSAAWQWRPEVDHGEWILSYEPKNKLPIEDFLRPQGRFKHLFKPGSEHLLAMFQEEVDRRWEDLQYLCAKGR